MKRKQINRGKKWLVAVLPPTTFVTITNQKCQLYPAVLKNYEHLLDRLYSMNAKMLDLIGEYPRIKLRISKI